MASYRKMTERLMTEAGVIAQERNSDITEDILREAADRIQNNGRKKAPEPPEGGISLSAAQRTFEINKGTISRWVAKGYIPVLLRTNKEVYVSELVLREVIQKYKENPGQGKKTILQSE